MAPELKILGWSIVFGLVSVYTAATLATRERGLKWNASNRDVPSPTLTGAAARAQRANANFLETFPFFAAALLAVVAAGRTSAHTLLGAEVYLAARVLYLPIYVVGIPYLRSAVYVVSIWGLLQLIEPFL